jgi:AraC-like DNA-binding protein
VICTGSSCCGGYNKIYFSRIFRRQAGISPFEYVQDKRISRAKQLLKIRWDMKVKEIAAECGYDDSKYFMTAFKRITGMTPVEYRNRSGS